MAWTVSHILFTILWLSLLFLLLHQFQNFKFKTTSKQTSSITFSSLSHNPLINTRKVVASKFVFTPFQKHHQQEQDEHSPDMKKQSEPADNEIDPRYGVQKRLVPTGSNPLHH
ncbi:CLAVATA3/ESR (CLE)-related protein 12-like [Durio zibethinus]|uniref:CLAVATA3/ESR (CLE)-related protein 12-like n=1 Tax=Durio zibethinus TaxID=66656 RepID=A0A6P5XG90_DURZI|nr:CLAVATA3/ESR (CLE)-related protein 12-like [Durio zibethinus]